MISLRLPMLKYFLRYTFSFAFCGISGKCTFLQDDPSPLKILKKCCKLILFVLNYQQCRKMAYLQKRTLFCKNQVTTLEWKTKYERRMDKIPLSAHFLFQSRLILISDRKAPYLSGQICAILHCRPCPGDLRRAAVGALSCANLSRKSIGTFLSDISMTDAEIEICRKNRFMSTRNMRESFFIKTGRSRCR